MARSRSEKDSTSIPRIGYACVTVGVPGTAHRTCTRRFATEEKLREIIAHNLDALFNQIAYNVAHNILLFRISSDIIPFAGTTVNALDWAALFEEKFKQIGALIRQSGMRVSMHPGQYTVLNSPDSAVVANAIADLAWHTRFLDALGVTGECKIIVHIGGVYGNKITAMKRFADNYRLLSPEVRSRLVIENDERSFSVEDVLCLHGEIGAPVVYDNLHREVYEGQALESHSEMILRCGKTWSIRDGRPKIHYAQQEGGKRKGAHSEFIRAAEFTSFFEAIRDAAPDIMLEVKDKNLSAVKCSLLVGRAPERNRLEEEWGRYKYLIMERSPESYAAIRSLFSGRAAVRPMDFYLIAEGALSGQEDPGRAENAALHVWGYFSVKATKSEKKTFFSRLDAYRTGKGSLAAVKGHLLRLAERYGEEYLLNSLYFYL